MTKIDMWQKKIRQIPITKLFLTKRHLLSKTIFQHFFLGRYHCKVDDPSIKKHTDIQPLHYKLWENLFSEFGQSSFTASKTNLFPPFLDTKPFFAMQVTRVGIMTVLLSLGLRCHQIKIGRLEFLQRCGTQITVNTWTGSFYYLNSYLLFFLRPNLFRY